jgi:hypothetical protein
LHRSASLNTTHPVLPRCASTTWVTNSAKMLDMARVSACDYYDAMYLAKAHEIVRR